MTTDSTTPSRSPLTPEGITLPDGTPLEFPQPPKTPPWSAARYVTPPPSLGVVMGASVSSGEGAPSTDSLDPTGAAVSPTEAVTPDQRRAVASRPSFEMRLREAEAPDSAYVAAAEAAAVEAAQAAEAAKAKAEAAVAKAKAALAKAAMPAAELPPPPPRIPTRGAGLVASESIGPGAERAAAQIEVARVRGQVNAAHSARRMSEKAREESEFGSAATAAPLADPELPLDFCPPVDASDADPPPPPARRRAARGGAAGGGPVNATVQSVQAIGGIALETGSAVAGALEWTGKGVMDVTATVTGQVGQGLLGAVRFASAGTLDLGQPREESRK